MSKILISALGAGRSKENRVYPKSKYKIENKVYDEESFIGIALIKHFQIDKNIIIGTSKSIWEEYYKIVSLHKFNKYNEEIYWDLAFKIDENNVNINDLGIIQDETEGFSKGILIDYGINNDELINNFHLLMNIIEELNDGDEIYIDITHSFRSLSLYMFIILNYLQNVSNKNIKISYISYGMFEEKKDNITPVINLNILYEAIEWIKGASEFSKYGNAYNLTKLMDNKDISKKINNFTDALNMTYVVELKKQVKQLSKINFDELKGFEKFIVPKVVEDFLNRFNKYIKKEKEYLFQLEISKFFYDKNMYSNAFLMLHESILTYFIEGDEDIKNMYSDEQTRYKIKNIVKNPYRAKDYKNDNDFNELCKIYKTITPIRNTIAHAIEEGRVSSTDISNFENLYYKKVAQIYSKNKSYYLGDYI